jgi:negative regulator of genetic competence, sporulation and motility
MEIKRIGENKIRCALSESEIEQLGFDIDEIIGDSETTQRFIQSVLDAMEEQENIHLEHISPMVRAELLPDHSMAITFGGDSDMGIQDLVDTVSNLMSRIAPERLEEFKRLNQPKKETKESTSEQKSRDAAEEAQKESRMICALRFPNIVDASEMCKVCFQDKFPKSALYKLDGEYYLVLDFTKFEKNEMRPFAFGAMEYDAGHISDEKQIAFIKEQGSYIVKKDAVEMLMQL